MTTENTTTIDSSSISWSPPNAIDSAALTVAHDGWMIVGKPTLRALLRYWWSNR